MFTPASADQRDQTLDFIRGVLIVGIVALHFGSHLAVSARTPNQSVYFAITLNQLFHCAVPGFLFLSGFANARRRGDRAEFLRFYLRRFRLLLPPYLAVSTIYVYLTLSHPLPEGYPLPLVLYGLVVRGGMDWPYYFIPLIAMCYLVFPFLYNLSFRPEKKGRTCAATLLVLAGLYVSLGTMAYSGRISFPFVIGSFLFWGIFFYVGMLSSRWNPSPSAMRDLKRLALSLLVISAALLSYATISILPPGSPNFLLLHEFGLSYVRPIMMVYNPVCVASIALIILSKVRLSQRFINYLGRNSLIIFLWHMPLLRLLWNVTPITRLSLRFLPLIPVVIFAVATTAVLGNELWSAAKNLFVSNGFRRSKVPLE